MSKKTHTKTAMPALAVLGWCDKCEQFIEGVSGYGWGLPSHDNKERKHCSNSGYSARTIKYRVDTKEQAIQLANVILEDDPASCLNGGWHDPNCGDGEHCAATRMRRAQALAQYLIDHHA